MDGKSARSLGSLVEREEKAGWKRNGKSNDMPPKMCLVEVRDQKSKGNKTRQDVVVCGLVSGGG